MIAADLPVLRKGLTASLLAYVEQRAMDENVPSAALDALIDKIVADPRESYLLLKTLRQWSDGDLPLFVERLLETRAHRLRSFETERKDIDETIAHAAAALPVALFVGIGVGVLAGTITAPIGPFALVITPFVFLGITVKRSWIRTEQRALSLQREGTESLARAVGEAIKAAPRNG